MLQPADDAAGERSAGRVNGEDFWAFAAAGAAAGAVFACLVVRHDVELWYLAFLVSPVLISGIGGFLIASVLVKPRNRPMLPAAVMQAGYTGGMVLILFSPASGAWLQPDSLAVARVLVAAGGAAWLILQPGRLVVVLLVIYHCASLITSVRLLLDVRNVDLDAPTHVGFLLVSVLSVLAVWFAVAGLRHIRAPSSAVELRGPFGQGDGI